MPSLSSQPSRRSVLTLGGLAVLAGCAPGAGPGGRVEHRDGVLQTDHRPGVEVRWRLAVPPSVGGLVVVLHGKGGDADSAFTDLRLDDHVVSSGLAVASVDGGVSYWHLRRDRSDTGAMVVDDLLPLLQDETGYSGRIALLGWSMGGYGALLLAASLGPDRVGAVVAQSAALWTEVRLDCGEDDPFAASNRAFGEALPGAELTLDAGGNTVDYWRGHAGAEMRWLAERLA